MPTTIEDLDTYINARWEEAHDAKIKATQGLLLRLAADARDEYPTATGIRLESSDQGDFMSYAGMLDAAGNNLDEDHEFDENADCWNFDDSNASTWQPFCSESPDSHRRDPKFVIQIDQVLAGISLTEDGITVRDGKTSIDEIEKFLAE